MTWHGAHAHPAPTGQQWTIGHGPYEAALVEVGGGLRTLTADGLDLVAGYAADETCQSGRGQQLMPWPNRIRDGKYTWNGVQQQLAITEVPKGNASHGLVRWALWELVDQSASAVTFGYRLHPQPGWDHHLHLHTSYVLDDTGLVVTSSARNVGVSSAPFGYGAHPYLALGSTPVDEAVLHVPAERWVESDERGLPVGVHDVKGSRHDFRTPRAIGPDEVDTAYTDIHRSEDDGLWRVALETQDRGTISLWADASFPWVQAFTGVAHLHKGRPGVAVEPMTCPADAFNSGDSLTTLEPGDEWVGTWGISHES